MKTILKKIAKITKRAFHEYYKAVELAYGPMYYKRG